MNNIIEICYKTICELKISREEKEALFRELSELGFTENLKQKLQNYLDSDISNSKKRLSDILEKKGN